MLIIFCQRIQKSTASLIEPKVVLFFSFLGMVVDFWRASDYKCFAVEPEWLLGGGMFVEISSPEVVPPIGSTCDVYSK